MAAVSAPSMTARTMLAPSISRRRSSRSASAPAGRAKSSHGTVTAKASPAISVGEPQRDQRERDLDDPVGQVGQRRRRPQPPEGGTQALGCDLRHDLRIADRFEKNKSM